MTDLDGFVITSKYCYHTTKLGYCGPKEMSKDIYESAKYGVITTDVENAMKIFAAFPVYYNLISSLSGMEMFSEDVVEAYWLGNDLSLGVKTSVLKKHLEDTILKLPLHAERLKPRIDAMPNGCRPTHNFHVLVLGSVTGVLPENMKNLNRCVVNTGEVMKGNMVIYRPLIEKGRRVSLGKPVETKMKFDFCDASPGDIVSLHWGYAVQNLNQRKMKDLKKNLDLHIRMRNKTKI